MNLTIPAAQINVLALAPRFFEECILYNPVPPVADSATPIVDTGISTPVAPGVTYESIPIISEIIDTSPSQLIGCVNDLNPEAQYRLDHEFPAAQEEDGVINRQTNDIWVLRGGSWVNVGPTPGPTIVVQQVIPPWNEIVPLVGRTRTLMFVNALNYGLELETIVDPISTITEIAAESRTINPFYVPVVDIEILGQIPIVSGGASVAPGSLTITLGAETPIVSGGASVVIPAVDIAVVPAPGPVVPREATVTEVPAIDVAVVAQSPTVAGGASVAVPVADVTVAAAVPTVSMVAPPLMKVLLYTGNASTNTLTGVGFEPGLVWTKRRTSSVADHAIYDYVQGTTKYWRSNQAAAQVTDANSLTAFNSDGFALGSAAISNTNSASYVAWCLTKGGTSSSNTDGSITTTVYANSTAGYNIFTYTGTGANATIGHGLGASPELVFIRNLGVAQSTAVGGDFLANNEYIFLGTSGKASSATVFQSYSSTTISVGSNSAVNGNGNSMLGYAFKSVAGNTDIGTYTGTGTTDQSVTCGFAPQFVLIKVYSTTGSWMIFDNTRGVTLQLAMGENSVESTVDKVTLDSNGFTVKANQNTNTNAASYVYLAIR